MPDLRAANLWKPRRFVDAAVRSSLGGFLTAYASKFFLLLDVRHAPGALLSGLNAITTLNSIPPIAGDEEVDVTTIADVAGFDTTNTELSEYDNVRRTATQIARRIANQERYIITIGKRVDNAVSNKITVGRTANNDIMLKHPSISKFHAWFEQRDDHLLLRDADSKNGTALNGEICKKSERLLSGDIVMFGNVEGMVCSAEALWQVLNMRSVPAQHVG